MSIVRKVRAVERLFKTLEKDIQKLQSKTGIHCLEGCVICCTTPKIMATSIEFYPLAFHLFKTHQAEAILSKIEQNSNISTCPLLSSIIYGENKPGCTFYEQRGLICRLFAYTHQTDKQGKRRIITCKTIKLNQPNEVEIANKILCEKPIGPKASDYYSRLQFIDYQKANQLYPIAEAIKLAIESVLSYYQYRGKKAV
ncbi:MAG: YkgJ family cysteine cluster protein [Bacteroidales bacterium]|nr:YkgJ family cysteine cluster protein [Bacteroidales bacterium]